MKKVYIIDGYNVIRSVPRYDELAARDMDASRARLIGDVSVFAGTDTDAIVVFDGASNPASDGSPHHVAGVDVVFSPYGKDADTVIEQVVAEHARAGDEVIVVTSDAQTQWIALGHGALRISSAGFGKQVSDATNDSAEHSRRGGQRHAIDERIDPATREALARWARGK